MGDEQSTTGTPPTNAAQPPASGTPEAGGGRPEYQPKGFVGSATGQPINTPPAEGGGTDDTTSDDEADKSKVVGHGGKPMPPEAISERVARERRRILKEEYGTDDENEIKRIKAERVKDSEDKARKLAEYEKLKADEEKRKRARMTELDRIKADKQRLEQEKVELQKQLEETKTNVLVEKQDSVVRETLSKHVRPERLKYARRDLAEYIQSLSSDEQKKFDLKKLDKWGAKFAQDNPDFAPPKGEDPAKAEAERKKKEAEAKPPPRRVPVGRPGAPKPTAPKPAGVEGDGKFKGKTVLPGKSNSMNRQELNEYMKSQGRRPW